jgi:tRNA/tmRNA/rRNA uracil-C5-methylase (TrmA/RlmC/RlmD family)
MKTTTITDPVNITKLIPGGQALGTREDGKKGLFWNALPGETITEYQITTEKSSYFEAIATKIDHPSSHRVEPKDPCYLSTSPWQIMDYGYELAQKSAIVKECFAEHHIDIPESQVATDGAEFYYRNKMEYALYWDNDENKIKLAFHARGSHNKIPIAKSSLEKPEIFTRAQEIIDELNSNGEEARKYQSLLLRSDQHGHIEGGLYENGQPHPEFNNLKDQILGKTYSYSPNGFFQINLPVYELALKEIKNHIHTKSVLDLYSGVGTIGLSVARDLKLTLVESNPDAYKELVKNCRLAMPIIGKHYEIKKTEAYTALESKRLHAYLMKSEDALDLIKENHTVIVDPPRAGCDQKLTEKLNGTNLKTIIYLSCNPITQARDIKALLSSYKIAEVQTYNFFPKTPHIENLVVLEHI